MHPYKKVLKGDDCGVPEFGKIGVELNGGLMEYLQVVVDHYSFKLEQN